MSNRWLFRLISTFLFCLVGQSIINSSIPIVFTGIAILTVAIFVLSRGNASAILLIIAAGPIINTTSFYYDPYIYNVEIVLLTYIGCFFWKKAPQLFWKHSHAILIYSVLLTALIISVIIHYSFYDRSILTEIRVVRLYLIGFSLLAFIDVTERTDLTVFYKAVITVASGISAWGVLEFGLHSIVLHNWSIEPKSIFKSSEILAIYLCIILPFIIMGKPVLKKRLWFYIADLSAILSILLLFATRSRTGIIAFLIFISLIGFRKIKNNSSKAIARLGLIGILFSGALVIVGIKTFHSGTISLSNVSSVLFSSRMSDWQEGVTILSNYPWWGIGSGNNVYNTFLQFQNQFGSIGLLGLLLLIGFILVGYIHNNKMKMFSPVHEGAFWSVITVLIAGMGESVLGNQIGYMVLFYLFLLI